MIKNVNNVKSRIIVDNKTLVTFIGHNITPDFAKAWLIKRGMKPPQFCLFCEKDKVSSHLMYTMP